MTKLTLSARTKSRLAYGGICVIAGALIVTAASSLTLPASLTAVDRTAMAAAPIVSGPAAAVDLPPIDKGSNMVLKVTDAGHLEEVFSSMGYTFAAVRDENALVPRLFLTSLPEDLRSMDSIEMRKDLFFNTMLPLVLRVNEQIMVERRRLHAIKFHQAAGEALSDDDAEWLANLAIKYRVADANVDELLLRVDTIPPSMALAQSAVESGWGTSRFAQQGNAVFGQITFHHSGIVPEDRKEGETHRFAAFGRLLDGTASYARNLNSHPAYEEFRRIRSEQRAAGQPFNGSELLDGLLSYSELGQSYVDYIRGVIVKNDLEQVNRARLTTIGRQLVDASQI